MFYKDKLVLVTGGTGFVGMHFVKALLQKGARVRVPIHNRPVTLRDPNLETIKADLTRIEDCLKTTEDAQLIFHAAGAVSSAGTTALDSMTNITTNLILTARMLQAAWEQNVERFLVFSSSTAYPIADYPIREDEMWNASPYPAYFGYGEMRRYLERLSEFVTSKSNMQIAICRPTAVYGRHDNFNPGGSHVIPALIRRAVENEDPFIVWGNGSEVRDFLHVTDLVNGCLLLMEKHAVCDPVNIGYGVGIEIKDIVKIILKSAKHTTATIKFDTSKPSTIPYRMVDTTKAGDILGFKPQIKYEDGIKDTVEWYIAEKTSKEPLG